MYYIYFEWCPVYDVQNWAHTMINDRERKVMKCHVDKNDNDTHNFLNKRICIIYFGKWKNWLTRLLRSW